MTAFRLFISFFKIGLFSFGGGLAMLPFIQEELIQNRGWISYNEFIDMLAISQVTPGPIAINSATFLGFNISGILGSSIATLAVILPSFIILLIAGHFLEKFKNSKYVAWILLGIKPIILGLIGSALYLVGKESVVDLRGIILALLVFFLVGIKKINPIICIIGAGITGVLIY